MVLNADRPDLKIPKHGPSKDILDVVLDDTRPATSHVLRQHYCLATNTVAEVKAWEQHLIEHNMPITGRMEWEKGGYSVYSRTDQILAGLEAAVDPNDDGDVIDAARIALIGMVAAILILVDSRVPATNAIKNMLLGMTSIVAAVVFVVSVPVRWDAVLPLAGGLLIGSALGPILVRRLPPNLVRWFAATCGLVLAAYLWSRPA